VGLQDVCEGLGGELRPLVGVEDLRGPIELQGLLQGLDTRVGLQGGGLKWSLRSGPHRRVLIWVLHSARILVGRQVSE
jgi:hypothetical protein